MQAKKNHVTLLLTVLAVAGLAACGKSTDNAGSGQPANQPNGTTSPTFTTAPQVPTPGQVGLGLGKIHYAVNEAMVVTILNGLTTPITASDHHSDCSLVDVQILTNNTWQTVGKCLQGRPTRLIPLAPGAASMQSISPGASNLAVNAAWPTGTYRIAFTYYIGSAESVPTATQTQTIYSVAFTV